MSPSFYRLNSEQCVSMTDRLLKKSSTLSNTTGTSSATRKPDLTFLASLAQLRGVPDVQTIEGLPC